MNDHVICPTCGQVILISPPHSPLYVPPPYRQISYWQIGYDAAANGAVEIPPSFAHDAPDSLTHTMWVNSWRNGYRAFKEGNAK